MQNEDLVYLEIMQWRKKSLDIAFLFFFFTQIFVKSKKSNVKREAMFKSQAVV